MTFSRGLAIGFAVLICAAVQGEETEPVGLIIHTAGAFEGYNLFAPLDSATTYLMDNEGRVIHTWESEYGPGNSAYLLPNGNLLRAASFGRDGNRVFGGGGAGYRVEEFAWSGERLWEFTYASDQVLMHHDIEPMPNGNVLILAWEMKTRDEAIAAGRNPELLPQDELWPEHVIEVRPIRPSGGEVVWRWHAWDHLIQDFDSSKENYGDVAAHPERIDVNPTGHWMDWISDEELEELEALGYLGGELEQKPKRRKKRGSKGADWHHTNAIAYNAVRDEIALSVLGNNELWIIDHSTTTEEARGSTGGRSGRGGDLLYRWGNPIAYRAGEEDDQRLFAQHDVRWIAQGSPGEGNLMIFNNGRGRPGGNASSVLEIAPPLDEQGRYQRAAATAYGPVEATWEYMGDPPTDFYASYISGADRLPNGNTLICDGEHGIFFEVTPDKRKVWRYVNPAIPTPLTEQEVKDRGGPKRWRKTLANIVYRVTRYAPDYPGLAGRDLTPGPLLTEYLESHPAKRPMELWEEVPESAETE